MNMGITFGAFDLLHAGHALFLLEASELCDGLIIGLHTDPSIERSWKHKPIQSTFERYCQLSVIEKVKCVVPYDTEKDLLNMLGSLGGIKYYFLGSDYLDKQLPLEVIDVCKKRGIVIKYLNRYHNYSSTELRVRVADAEAKSMGIKTSSS